MRRTTLTLVLLALAGTCNAEAYKCKTADGYVYTDIPCSDPVKYWSEPFQPKPSPAEAPAGGSNFKLVQMVCSGDNSSSFATGTVRNISSVELDFVRVNASFLSARGELLDTGYTFTSPRSLRPNQVGQFKVYGPGSADRCQIQSIVSND